MMDSVLVVCVGNICRSPVGERLLQSKLAALGVELPVTSAGIGALVGHEADADATAVAAENGVSLAGHLARQFTGEMGRAAGLVLVMEPGHQREIVRRHPDLSGKVMTYDHWQGGKGIADPYRLSRDFHREVYRQIATAAESWAAKLGKSKAR